MPSSITKWNESHLAARLRRRRRWRLTASILLTAILLSAVADHLRAQNRTGDDWLHFDGHSVQYLRATAPDSIAVQDASDQITIVHILGIRSATPDWDARAQARLDSLLTARTITIHLEPTQTRDPAGDLLADVFTDTNQLLAAQLVAEGLMRPDPLSRCTFYADILRSQSQARKKRLGIWNLE